MAGLIALILYAFDPNILGHNHFVTTDLGIAAFMTFSFYYYLKFIKHPTWRNVLLAGVFLGLLQLAKFSFIIALPIFGMATIIYPLVIKMISNEKNNFVFRVKKLGIYIGKGALVFSISLIVVWLVYGLNTLNIKSDIVAQTIDVTFPPSDTANPNNIRTNKILHLLNANAYTRPLTEYGLGIGYVFRRVSGGNGAYFMGQVSSTAFRAYFPAVFLIKEPIPSLFFMFFALLLGCLKVISTFRKSFSNFFKNNFQNISHYLRAYIVEFSMVVFIFLYSYVSITGNLNIGFRHLFPILPFIYLLTAKTLSNFLKNKIPQHQAIASYQHNSQKAFELAKKEISRKQKVRIFSFAFILLFAYFILETIIAYPSYMSYFNESVGGPKNGYKYVTDSNADWGQDLKRLKLWIYKTDACLKRPERKVMCENVSMETENKLREAKNIGKGIDKIRVDYFGGGDIKTYIGDKYLMWWDSKRPVETGWYAISTNFLQGSLYDTQKPDNESYRWLKNKKPAYQVGTSILIYYITPEEATAVSQQQF